jgi:hypothetical protein
MDLSNEAGEHGPRTALGKLVTVSLEPMHLRAHILAVMTMTEGALKAKLTHESSVDSYDTCTMLSRPKEEATSPTARSSRVRACVTGMLSITLMRSQISASRSAMIAYRCDIISIAKLSDKPNMRINTSNGNTRVQRFASHLGQHKILCAASQGQQALYKQITYNQYNWLGRDGSSFPYQISTHQCTTAATFGACKPTTS